MKIVYRSTASTLDTISCIVHFIGSSFDGGSNLVRPVFIDYINPFGFSVAMLFSRCSTKATLTQVFWMPYQDIFTPVLSFIFSAWVSPCPPQLLRMLSTRPCYLHLCSLLTLTVHLFSLILLVTKTLVTWFFTILSMLMAVLIICKVTWMNSTTSFPLIPYHWMPPKCVDMLFSIQGGSIITRF